MSTGIRFEPIIPGIVPEAEEREAAKHNGYTWRNWLELEHQERVDGVAWFRLTRLLELHSQEETSRYIESRRAQNSGS